MIGDATDILNRAQAEYRRALRAADSKLAAAVAQSPAYLQEALALQARYASVGYEPAKLGAYLQPAAKVAPTATPEALKQPSTPPAAKPTPLAKGEAVLSRKQQETLDNVTVAKATHVYKGAPAADAGTAWTAYEDDGGEPVK
jgi:hypothetical protein